MEIRIEAYTGRHEAAARGFNERIAGAADFGLPPDAPLPEPEDGPIRNLHFVVLEEDTIRGGFLLAGFTGWFNEGQAVRVWNCREPISEGIVNSKYSLLAIHILKHIQRHSPYVFALGMGGEQLPFPRLLRGAGWTIDPVPFLFRIVSAGRFARELSLLQGRRLRPLARLAASVGAAQAGAALLQIRSLSASFAARGCTIEMMEEWGDWADEVWSRFGVICSFSVERNREMLRSLYPLADGRITAWLIRHRGAVLGWAATMNTQMENHKYFGNMRVGTILDCVAAPEGIRACAALVTKILARQGADLIVTNQSHVDLIRAFRQTGFLSGRSNYILATSKGFSEAISKQQGGRQRVHFTRGDSDGRGHL